MPPEVGPGSFSTMKAVMASGPVRARSITSDARRPLVTHALVPSITHSSPSRSARHRNEAASLPLSGSERLKAARNEPCTIRGRKCAFCSSVPKRPIMVAAILWVLITPERVIHPRASSSMMRA